MKPVSLLASVLGLIQCVVPVSFSLPPATSSPPKNSINSVHSASVGKCHPSGHAVFEACQLYNTP
ncbi:MAG: hypothetical protein RBT13_04755 [Bacteroidales bacterium]|nr:hypothetical protein [Bacteroidales bacterium]